MNPEAYVHQELAASRSRKDETAVEEVQDVLDNVIANPWNPMV